MGRHSWDDTDVWVWVIAVMVGIGLLLIKVAATGSSCTRHFPEVPAWECIMSDRYRFTE